MTYTTEEVPLENNLLGDVLRYEEGDMDEVEAVRFFGYLVQTGIAWQLQGSYGRGAEALIRDGILSPSGEVLVDLA